MSTEGERALCNDNSKDTAEERTLCNDNRERALLRYRTERINLYAYAAYAKRRGRAVGVLMQRKKECVSWERYV